MNTATPHFLLFSESRSGLEHSRWRFVLEALDGTDKLEASDVESEVHGERLELLAVVRGLEALPQPSRVTLVTPSRYVDRGLTDGLPEWRNNNWQWEHFGEMAPVKNRDLWQRIDRALEFHQVDCRLRRLDEPERHRTPPPHSLSPSNCQDRTHSRSEPLLVNADRFEKNRETTAPATAPVAIKRCDMPSELLSQQRVKPINPDFRQVKPPCPPRPRKVSLRRRAGELLASLKFRLAQFGTGLLPPPWLS